MRTCRTIETPIGPLRLDVEEGALVAVHLPDERRPPIAAAERPEDPVLATAAKQLEDYVAGRRTTFDLPLRPQRTPFSARCGTRCAPSRPARRAATARSRARWGGLPRFARWAPRRQPEPARDRGTVPP
jgi:hypothetical protein